MNDQRRALLLFIDERIRTTGVSPTMHEMANAIGNKHRSGAHRYLAMLESEGWIRRTARRKQSIEVLRTPGNVKSSDVVREEIILRLAAELARRNPALNDAQGTKTVFAGWMLETIEGAGFRLIDQPARPAAPHA
jgi:repressor LexA